MATSLQNSVSQDFVAMSAAPNKASARAWCKPSALVKDTVSAAEKEYRTLFKHEPPFEAARRLEKLLAQQIARQVSLELNIEAN
jgi:hypothetical protein